MAHTFALGAIDDADCTLEPRLAQMCAEFVACAPSQEEAPGLREVKQRLVAAGERRADQFALGSPAPTLMQRSPCRGR
jgi:hypothetical protein